MMTPTEISWPELGLSPELLTVIENAGYKSPTPVQAQTIPFAIQGKDVLVSSQTGSGKTASFVIPSVERFKGRNGTYILALSPTREIAQQTGAVFETFGKPFGLKTVVCIGGASLSEEKEALSSSPHIIVATPGRLCDHLERGNVWLDFIQCLIFDEADRMLEMGFAKQIDTITEQISKDRQTLMLSATFSPVIEKLARKAMRDPEKVVIERTAESAPKIDQQLFWINEDKKLGYLMQILREEQGTVFVFVKAKERTYQICRLLQNKGFASVTYINSDLPQDARELAVAEFKSGKYRVIIATDIMGRGIDVDDVAHVVNYDVPSEAEDYIHRIGRTGRRGLTGNATTFAIPGKDDKAIKAIEKMRGVNAPEKPQAQVPRSAQGQGSGRARQDSTRNGDRSRNDNSRHEHQYPPRKPTPRQGQKPLEAKPERKIETPLRSEAGQQVPTPVVKEGLFSKIKRMFGGK